jgi:hypothetical protein
MSYYNTVIFQKEKKGGGGVMQDSNQGRQK